MGGSFVPETTELASVTFAAPVDVQPMEPASGPAPTAPPVRALARAEAEEAPSPNEPAQAAAPAPPAPPAPPPVGATGDMDEIYDQVLRRLRRDLLREREQMGDLLGDLY